MDDYIIFSWLREYNFCPVSIYFQQLYGEKTTTLVQTRSQLEGTYAHSAVDEGRYSTRKDVLQGQFVICEAYRLFGRIDVFDVQSGILTERKNKISKIYDGYIFQLYAQYFSLLEMGYKVNGIRFHSLSDNRNWPIPLPEESPLMLAKFERTIADLRNFKLEEYTQENPAKCQNCIYEPACDRTLL